MDTEQVRKAAEDIHEAATLSAEEIKEMARRLLELENANRCGEWVCAVCGRGSEAHASGFMSDGCVYKPHWRPLPAPPANEDRGMKPAQEEGRTGNRISDLTPEQQKAFIYDGSAEPKCGGLRGGAK